jgi:hypothetical protein
MLNTCRKSGMKRLEFMFRPVLLLVRLYQSSSRGAVSEPAFSSAGE